MALCQLMTGYRDQLERLARMILGDGTAAEEVVQETFVLIWTHRRQYRPDKSAWGWMTKILRNGCYALWRREDRHKAKPANPGIDLTEYVCLRSAAPDKAAEQSELICLARQFIVDLPPQMREVVHLAVFAEASDSEISGLLGIPVGTVKSRKNRAMALLKARMNRAGGD